MSMSHERSITIDGPAGSGKSTAARMLAQALGYRYVSTGDLYRALALAVIRVGADPANEEDVSSVAHSTIIEIRQSPDGGQRTFLNGEDVSEAIRSSQVDSVVSPVSVHPEVRKWLLGMQRAVAHENDVVMDGRDIGSVVLAGSKCKFFLTASAEERARRRLGDYVRKGRVVDLDTVLKEINERDAIDSSRPTSPLVIPVDAVVVDCTSMDAKQVVQKMLSVLGRSGVCSTPLRD